ncbi:MAG: hypothetical protein KDK96_02860 [Chlamydiia bacterium]|nr:hypothetical protein [Chlamydiia bacterium]
MAQVLFSQALEAYSKFQTLTDTDAAKQKIIQTVALLVVANAAYNASRTRLTQATISMSAATVLWMNQEAFLHKALSENVGALSVHITDLNGALEKKRQQIEQMDGLIREMGELRTGSGALLKDQAAQLSSLKEERAALEAQVRELDRTRVLIQGQVEALEQTRRLFDEHIAATSKSIQSALQQRDGSVKV